MNLAGSIKITKCGMSIICVLLILSVYYLTVSERKISNLFSKSNKDINLRKLLVCSIQAAINGGKEVVAISKTDMRTKSKGKTKEGVNDPVTIADFNSHCVMTNSLRRMFPKLKIISEEDAPKDCPDIPPFDLNPNVVPEMSSIPDEYININDVTVWIDPLDATKEYTEQLFEYVTTMICVAIKDKPIIGIIHNPFTSVTVWAWVGKNMSNNLIENRVTSSKSTQTNVVVSRSHAGKAKEISKQIFGDNVNVTSAAGAGYKSLQVAFKHAIYVHLTRIKRWDICAGNAIINSLGGKMTTLHGVDISYSHDQLPENDDGLLAIFNSVQHEIIVQKIKENNINV